MATTTKVRKRVENPERDSVAPSRSGQAVHPHTLTRAEYMTMHRESGRR